ncbi:hypothetical protein H632_c212p0, partial [Helicosporidium sp. ATCC 50920]
MRCLQKEEVQHGAKEGCDIFGQAWMMEHFARYHSLPAKVRHHYEIIREGHRCHLYFDLERPMEDQGAFDGDAAVDEILRRVRLAYQTAWSLTIEDAAVVELDSSTEAKWSRHLIIRVPGAVWENNAHVGAFVRDLCARMLRDEEEWSAESHGASPQARAES